MHIQVHEGQLFPEESDRAILKDGKCILHLHFGDADDPNHLDHEWVSRASLAVERGDCPEYDQGHIRRLPEAQVRSLREYQEGPGL